MAYEDPRITALNQWLDAQVGIHEGRDPDGNWNNIQPYAPYVGQPNGQAWCQEFAYAGNKHAGLGAYFPNEPWVPTALAWGYQHGYVSQYPATGADIEFGGGKHYGKCRGWTAMTVTTVEGNTSNVPYAAQGDGVYRKSYQRTDPFVDRYIYPHPSTGVILDSADPVYNALPEVIAAKRGAAVPTTPATPMVTFADSAVGFNCLKLTVAQVDAFIKALKTAGHGGLFVYIGPNPEKNIPTWAVLRIAAAGIAISFVFEGGQYNASGGAAQAKIDAALAIQQLKAHGAAGVMVWITADHSGYTFAAGTPENAYFATFAAALRAEGFIPGGYGNRALMDSGLTEGKWLVWTWTNGNRSGVHAVQYVNPPIPRKVSTPFDCDTNLIVHGFRCLVAVPAPAHNTDANVAELVHQARLIGGLVPSTPRGIAAHKTLEIWKAVA